MKRSVTSFFRMLFTLLIIGCSGSMFAQGYSGGGPGTNPDFSDAYEISTLADLQYLSENNSDWGLFFIQTADIDAAATSGWNAGEGFIPIGDAIFNFTGGYDGQGHTISNLYINRPGTDDVGLFGNAPGTFPLAYDVTVKNLGLLNVDITGQAYVGAIGGEILNVENCYSTGSVTGIYNVGGIAGMIIISNYCYSSCSVTGDYCGGFAGYNLGNIFNCYSTGSVTGTSTVGGFIGTNDAGIIQYCYSTGSVSGTTDVGGFIGVNYYGSADDCFWNTETSGQALSTGSTPWPINVFGKTTAEMKRVGTYLSDPGLSGPWDFTLASNIWGFNGTDNNGYPILRMEGFIPGNIWFGTSSTDWDDTDNWSEEAIPVPADKVFIPDVLDDDPILGSLAEMTGLTIELGGVLNLTSAGRLTVSGILTNEPGNAGLVLDPDASLVNGTTGVPGTVKREIAKDWKWHFLSCPVSQATMPEICDGNFAPLTTDFPSANTTYDFFYWQEPPAPGNKNWINLKNPDGNPNTVNFGSPPEFVAGKGYLVEYGPSFAGDAMKSFEGELGAGSFTIPVTNTTGGPWSGFNLIGNAYPSSIDWKSPSGWDRTPLEMVGPISTQVRPIGGYMFWIWNDVSGNYGYYNSALPGDAGGNGVSRYIPPTQAFFVKAQTGGNVTMDDGVRCHSTQDWLKEEGNTLRVRVTSSATSYSDEVLLAFNSITAGGGDKLFSLYEEAPSLYLPVENNNYCIRFIDDIGSNPAIPVSLTTGKDGNYTITVTGTEGLSNVFLQDLKTGATQDVKAQPSYTFASASSDDAGRFLIRFTPLGIDQKHSAQDVFVYENVLNINDPGKAIITVYNMTGMKMLEKRTEGEQTFRISLQLPTGYYLVKVTNEAAVWSQKVFVR